MFIRTKRSTVLTTALGCVLALAVAPAAFAKPVKSATPEEIVWTKELLKKSIGFHTVEGQGQVPVYAQYLASQLKEAGYSDQDIVITPMGETATMTVTLRGTKSAKPIILLGHMDVVEAKAADWTRDPFVAVEENGYIYGRGSEDNKYDVTILVATMARLKKAGFKPDRDIILALSGDEETQMATTRSLAQKFKGAEFALNGDAGGGQLDSNGKPQYYGLQAAEKTYANFEIMFTDPGGHSSTPTRTNPVYRLAKALERIGAYDFPNQYNELTSASLSVASKQIGGDVGGAMARFVANPDDVAAANIIASQPEYIGQIRTTCVATMVTAGHAQNALPQRAAANINCRIFPGVSIDTIKAQLTKVIADDSAKITVLANPLASDASPLRADVVNAVTKAVHARSPGLTIIPSMSAGATDSLYFRAVGVPSYGISSLFIRAEDGFAHGLNERVPSGTIGAALDQWYSVLTDLGRK